MRQPRYVSSSVCEQVLPPARAIELAELALSWEARDRVHYPIPRALRMRPPDHMLRFHSKAAALPELGVAGCRIVGYRAESDGTRPGAEAATRLVVLIDLETGAPLAIVDKRRVDVDVSEVMNLIGDVRGRSTLIVDDIIDTAGTLVKTAEALLREGATQVYAACTHAVLSGPAIERIEKSRITEIVATDSVPLSDAAKKMGKITVLSVADLLARGIRSIHEETSISELFI